MTTVRLPPLADVHVHVREPGATHKEDWETATKAALAGGFTTILAMPNTQPPITDGDTLSQALDAAIGKARCDFGQYLGAGPDNAKALTDMSARAAGLKMYLDQTFGELRLDDMTLWATHFAHWPDSRPLAVHAEGRTLAAAILLAALYQRPVHLCHVSRREEILLIREAKAKGLPVTCEVAPHHLFLTDADIPALGAGRAEVRPRLATGRDRQDLWDNLDVIDCFATDHAPHTLAEKDSSEPPPGYPGLETALPLLLTAVHDGRLTMEDLIARFSDNPRRIFGLPQQPETFIEIDPDARWEIRADQTHTRCAWTPFEGLQVRGRVRRVVLRGEQVMKDNEITAPPGYGMNVRRNPDPQLQPHS